jgi:signal transduction histidine kinase
MLHEFLTTNTQEIIARVRAKVIARTTHAPAEIELVNGVPLFLSQLIDRLSNATADSEAIEESAALHGGELLAKGFSVSQVVHGYGDVCQVVTALADETHSAITVEEFHTFNRCLDDAIAHSVTEYERRRDLSVAFEGMERLGVLAHELRNRLSAAFISFGILQEGIVGVGGSTGAVLGRSLRGMRDIINNSLASVRLEAGISQRRRVSVAELVSEAEVEASLGADVGDVRMTMSPVARDIEVQADRQVLAAAIGNLLQNAFKFSHPHGRVSLRTTATAQRVSIEIEDECGGLPAGQIEDLFRPFEQRSTKRSGLGLGLTISRKGIEAMGGTLSVRDLPGKGCIFAIDLPRLAAGASVAANDELTSPKKGTIEM